MVDGDTPFKVVEALAARGVPDVALAVERGRGVAAASLPEAQALLAARLACGLLTEAVVQVPAEAGRSAAVTLKEFAEQKKSVTMLHVQVGGGGRVLPIAVYRAGATAHSAVCRMCKSTITGAQVQRFLASPSADGKATAAEALAVQLAEWAAESGQLQVLL